MRVAREHLMIFLDSRLCMYSAINFFVHLIPILPNALQGTLVDALWEKIGMIKSKN